MSKESNSGHPTPAAIPSIGQPVCPLCVTTLEDPAPGTDCNAVYEVICPRCHGWIELHRFARVTFRTCNWAASVPPRVFLGLEPLSEGELEEDLQRQESEAPPRSKGHRGSNDT